MYIYIYIYILNIVLNHSKLIMQTRASLSKKPVQRVREYGERVVDRPEKRPYTRISNKIRQEIIQLVRYIYIYIYICVCVCVYIL